MTLAPLTLPRRSVLYVPGSNARALVKSASLPADGLVLDLEDAVLPTAKLGARAAVLAAVAERWSMAETPRGILNMDAIARCTPRLSVIVLGTADLGNALRVPEVAGRAALVPALAHCVLAARAAGLDILDGVYPHLTDLSGFRAECLQGRQLGFDGKTLIHPGQIAGCNDAFGVSAAEAARAAGLIAAWEAAAASGAGVAVHEGRLVERLHVEAAQRLLGLYQTIHDRTMPAQAPGTRPA